MHHIPEAVMQRLPQYYRVLNDLQDEGCMRLSSQELSFKTGFTPSQIRQDLSNLGELGQQGYGYNVQTLQTAIGTILKLQEKTKILLIGTKESIPTLLSSTLFSSCGMICLAAFEEDSCDPYVVEGTTVYPQEQLDSYLQKNKVDIVILSTSVFATENLYTYLVSQNIQGIFNFTPKNLLSQGNTIVTNCCPFDSLCTLNYLIHEKREEDL